ncbi:MAG TPA: tetratricopeptide repeat protein [Gemmataceae bacterium]|nr:tetratricopeptide repeat protein [Gemmataceae bacterium]
MTPTDELFARALAHHQGEQLTEAEGLYRQVLAADPHHAGALTNLGVIAARAGNPDEAERLYRAAIAAEPHQIDARFNLGRLYRKLGRPQDAMNAFQAVLRIDPNHPKTYHQLGLVTSDVGEWPTAVDCFRCAIALDPGLADAHNLLGDTLYRAGRIEEALRAWQEFVVRCPDDPRAHNNLGLALAALGQAEEAVSELELALKLRPDYPEAHNMLGVMLEGLGQADDAQQHYREAVKLRPEFAEAANNLGTSLTEQGRVTEAIAALLAAQELRPSPRTGDNLLLALAYSSSLTPEQLRDEHAAWATRFTDPLAPDKPPRIPNPDPNRRLRVGYVSGDFRTHSAAGLIERLLTHHDRNAVHVTCYSNVTLSDETTDRLRRLADGWRQVVTLPDAALAEQVRTDEIDVLVDLSGHTAGNRLLAFARKPAPVQIALFGYPCTTGLKAIDFRVSDPFASPPEADELSVEAILRLPEIGWVYSSPSTAPTPSALPAQSRRAFTFGCLNNPAKLSDACIETWAAVLKAVPKSRLVLMAGRSAEAARVLAERFTRLGVASDRLELVYRLPANEYFDAYQPLDLCLDPFPFNGMLTTCDALWMGLPVLTLAGRDTRSRQGVSILSNLGLPEFVADSPEKLVELAAIWSDQRPGLADLRGSLREMMRQSPVTNAAAFVRHLEAAYRSAWQVMTG